jgi:hypothetical protein
MSRLALSLAFYLDYTFSCVRCGAAPHFIIHASAMEKLLALELARGQVTTPTSALAKHGYFPPFSTETFNRHDTAICSSPRDNTAASMTVHDPSPPRAPPLTLPAPSLNFATQEPHPDSEEYRQRDKHRTARELESIYEQSGSPRSQTTYNLSPNAPQARHPRSTRSRANSGRSSSYRGGTRPCPSEAPTAPDSEGPDAHDDRRYRLRRQVPHWYDPAVKFWRSQVSVTIDEGQHRDHLGMQCYICYARVLLIHHSTRANIPWVPTNLSCLRYVRRDYRTIVPSAAHKQPEHDSRLLRARYTSRIHLHRIWHGRSSYRRLQVLAAAECNNSGQGACWRLGNQQYNGVQYHRKSDTRGFLTWHLADRGSSV